MIDFITLGSPPHQDIEVFYYSSDGIRKTNCIAKPQLKHEVATQGCAAVLRSEVELTIVWRDDIGVWKFKK